MTRAWRDDALCSGMAPLFDDHIDGESSTERGNRIRYASRICADCPVADLCEATVDRTVDEGVRAGRMLPPMIPTYQRLAHGVRRRAEIKHGTMGGYRQHNRRNEPMCEKCRSVRRDADRKREQARRPESAA